MHRIAPSQVLRFIASIAVIVLLTPLSPAVVQQKPTPPSPNSQAQLEARVKDLEARLNAAEQKAASAAMEKDYITRVQKQYETYYEKVLSTQTWTLTIFGLILTAVFAIAAKFSIDIFDSRTKSALDAALAQVEKRLSEQNDARLKTLEEDLTKRITEQEQDLNARSDFQFQCAQGIATGVGERYAQARNSFRTALRIYKSSKPRKLFEKDYGATTVRNILIAFRREDKANYELNAKKELAHALYNDLDEELTLLAFDEPDLAPLLKERRSAPSPPTSTQPKTGQAEPDEPPLTATSKDNK